MPDEDDVKRAQLSTPVTVSISRMGGFAGLILKRTAIVQLDGYVVDNFFTHDPNLWEQVINLYEILLHSNSTDFRKLPNNTPDQFNYHVILGDATGKIIQGVFKGQQVPEVVSEIFNILSTL